MDCSPPVSSIHGILWAKILEWIAIPFSRGSSWPRDWTWVSCIAGRFFTIWAIEESPLVTKLYPTLCDLMACQAPLSIGFPKLEYWSVLPVSSVHWISQARILKWVAISFSRGSSLTQRLKLHLLHCRWILYHWATQETPRSTFQESHDARCYITDDLVVV